VSNHDQKGSHPDGQRMRRLFDKAVDDLLGRERYERRMQVGGYIDVSECCRCHTRPSCNFSRNAGRMRHQLTKCECGGSIKSSIVLKSFANPPGATMLITGVPILHGEASRMVPLNAGGTSTDITIVVVRTDGKSTQNRD